MSFVADTCLGSYKFEDYYILWYDAVYYGTYFEGIYYIHFQDRRLGQRSKQQTCFFLKDGGSAFNNNVAKFTTLYDVASNNVVLFIVTALCTSNPSDSKKLFITYNVLIFVNDLFWGWSDLSNKIHFPLLEFTLNETGTNQDYRISFSYLKLKIIHVIWRNFFNLNALFLRAKLESIKIRYSDIPLQN